MANTNAEDLCQQARQAIKQRDFEQAQQFYHQALGFQADSTDALYGLGTVSFMLKEYDKAIDFFQQVLQFDPRRAAVHINLGAIYNRLGQLDKAIESLRRGIQYDPHRAEGFYNLGLVYKTKRELNLAIQAYREAIRINPRMADAHLNLANLLVEREEYGTAKIHYQHALDLQPNWDSAERGLARAAELQQASKQPAAPAPVSTAARARVIREFQPGNEAADQERHLNPEVHSDRLHSLHRVAIETEGQSLQFIQVLSEEIEPVVKELSNCLLMHGGVALALDLDTCLQKLDEALDHLTTLNGTMQSNLDQIREQGVQLLRS